MLIFEDAGIDGEPASAAGTKMSTLAANQPTQVDYEKLDQIEIDLERSVKTLRTTIQKSDSTENTDYVMSQVTSYIKFTMPQYTYENICTLYSLHSHLNY
jgi:hypothetical protein